MEPEALGTIIKRLSGKGTECIPEELVENMRYLKRQWLNDITFQVRTNLGEECLTWNPSLCRDLVSVDDATGLAGGAVMLCGPVGTGKTTAAVHILLALAEHYADAIQRTGGELPDADDYVVILKAPAMFRKMSQLFGNGGEEANTLIDRCCHARILLVDDLGTEKGTDDACAAFDEIMDTRYQGKRNHTTIVCANIAPGEWGEYRGGKFVRLADRWRQDKHCIVLKGESMRATQDPLFAWPEEET